jgi:hypothetical protein
MNILNKLTQKHLIMNKKRTIVSIVGIILSTALMVGIGLLLSTFRESMVQEIVMSEGDYNARIDNISKNNLAMISNNSDIEHYITRNYLGYAPIPSDNTKSYFKVFSTDTSYMSHLKLLSGRLPKNDKEVVIPKYLEENYPDLLKVGETLSLSLGDRYYNNLPLTPRDNYTEGEYINNPKNYTFTIVGVIERDYYEDSEIGCFIYTTGLTSDNMDIFITYKNVNKTYDNTKNIAKSLSIVPDSEEYYTRIRYNSSLLALYGASSYHNLINSMAGMLAIMLSLVSIACIIVIYNSFAISVMERKKQFGLFSSIGATRRQIKSTVLYEAMIVSLIGIPLGILSAYLGIYIVVLIMNNLLKGIFSTGFHLSTYPLFIIIPIIFMIITIFISASIPAKKASKISPIEAIRLNDDIKIKGKKVKSPKFIKKIFGIEGDIAYKNMRRNKKKYRITVVSLFISIVLFIAFSGYMTYFLASANSYLAVPDVDIRINYDKKLSDPETIKTIKSNPSIEEYMEYDTIRARTNTDMFNAYTKKYQKFLVNNNYYITHDTEYIRPITFIIMNNDSYNKYLNKIGKKEPLPILYNNFNSIIYSSNSRKSYHMDKYNGSLQKINILVTNDDISSENSSEYKNLFQIDNYYISNDEFVGLGFFNSNVEEVVIISEDMAKNYKLLTDNPNTDYSYTNILIKAPSYKSLDKMLEEYDAAGKLNFIYYTNIKEELKMENNLILTIKILVYGFITLVTLIGITSVFNTINTSIALRRKEFAVLRSVGLTPKGFNKMLCFESLFFGLKSLLYAIPVSCGIIFLMYLSMRNTVELETILIPWKSIFLAIVLDFLVIAISMSYATKKVKKDNILDAIREENI